MMGKGLNRAKKTTGKKIAKWHDRTGHLPSSLNGTLTQDERALAYMKNHKPYQAGGSDDRAD